MNTTVRTRFAPSPTGALHIGSVRTALFSWLYARRHGGHYILRIEDTDQERSSEAFVDAILEGFAWLGLHADEGPIFQSRRLERYREVAERMLADGRAYRCYCTPEELAAMRAEQMASAKKPRYDGRCRDRERPRNGVAPVVRFRNPESGQVVVEDHVHGQVAFENAELDDLVILRSNGTPTYHFGVVVDDSDMNITHVIRGDDHLNNTPRHINLFRALGFAPPHYAHLPMIAGPDGAKLSKRHGAVSVLEYRDQGYLPDAMLNYLVRLGWSHGDQEIFSREEMIAAFDLDGVHRSPARFDVEKLGWLNQHYIKSAATQVLTAGVAGQLQRLGVGVENAAMLAPIVEAFRERAKTLAELAEKARVYLEDFAEYDAKGAAKHLTPESAGLLRAVRERLAAVDAWTAESTQAVVEEVANGSGAGMGKVAQPIRVAVTGGTASPGIGVTLHVLGREKTLQRLDRAIAFVVGAASDVGAASGRE
jgi:glutamyl-tRNA synthetase